MVRSAGILAYRGDKVFLVRCSGPYDRGKNRWGIPKGHVEEGETLWQCAIREFNEESGDVVRTETYIDLGEIRRNGKCVHIYAVHQDAEWKGSNSFEHVFKNGTTAMFFETDGGAWFSFDTAEKILPRNQAGFIPRLAKILGYREI